MHGTILRVFRCRDDRPSGRRFPGFALLFVVLLFAGPAAAQSVSTEQNTNRLGSDYRNFAQPFHNLDVCRQACVKDAKCVAYTYVKPGFQGPVAHCWLKSAVPAAQANDCCVSGVKASAGLQTIKPGQFHVNTAPATGTPVKIVPGMQQIHNTKATEPDALGKGSAIGRPGDDAAHMANCSGGGALDSVLNVVSFIVNQFGGNISHHAYCGNEKREIAAGVTLASPPAAKEPSPKWGYIGGQGDLMADATVCLIKDIGNVQGGRIDHRTPTTGGAVPVSAEQIVGLESFDPAAKKAVFYHVVRACAPMIGCMDAARQQITAQVRSNIPAWPANMRAGDFPILNSYAVELDSQWSASDFNITLPQITIPTPYGILKAQPKVTWAARLLTAETPFPTKDARVTLLAPGGRGTSTAVIQDTYGLSGTPFIIQTATNLYHQPQQGFGVQGGVADAQGWSSQIGFGARNGAFGTAIWSPGTNANNPPLRPDLNLDAPRSQRELGPGANFTAEVPITYSPPNPLELLPSAIRSQASMSLTITVDPKLAADYASQVGLIARDANYTNCHGIEFGESCNLSEVLMPMQVKATGRAEITGNVELHISFSIPFVPDVDIHQPFKVDLPGGHASYYSGYSENDPYTHVARATRLTFDRPDKNQHTDTLIGPSGQKSNNLENWRQVCMVQPPKTTAPPPPSRQPDNKTYMPDLLPCNICATDSHINAHNGGNPLPRIFAVAQHSYGAGKEWVCEWKGNQGCYDLCSWDKNTGKFVAAVQSAVDVIGGRCTSHEQIIK